MRLFISTLMVLFLTLAGNQARAEDGWIRVYLGDSDQNQVGANGSCTIVVTPKVGEKSRLKAKLVTPHQNGSGAKLDHGGQVIGKGEYTVELVVAKAEEAHDHAATGKDHDAAEEHEHGDEHGEAEEHGHGDEHGEATDADEGLAYFQAPFSLAEEAAFDALVIIKTDKGTFNVKGFEYPFLDYSSIVSLMEAHVDEIQELIDSGQLLKVHSVASKISRLAESLPNAKDFPGDERSKVESTCKEIISLFAEIDKAADAEKKAETIQVLGKYSERVAALEKYAHEEPGHGEHDH